jgi:hypothetical protein
MRFVPSLIAGIAGALIVAMPAAAAPSRAEAGQATLAKALEGRTAGTPVNCITLRNIRSTTIIDRTAIIYDMGGTLYVNTPEGGASSLDSDDILFTKTYGSQLCDLDVVRLVDRNGNFPRGFVNLGKFVPYTKAKAAS